MSNLIICEKCKKTKDEAEARFPMNVDAFCNECNQIYPTKSTWSTFGVFDPCCRIIWLCDDCCVEFSNISREKHYELLLDFIQPERSKREDLDCCERLKQLDELECSLVDYIPGYNHPQLDFVKELLQEAKMRCSEHCGNTVRDK